MLCFFSCCLSSSLVPVGAASCMLRSARLSSAHDDQRSRTRCSSSGHGRSSGPLHLKSPDSWRASALFFFPNPCLCLEPINPADLVCVDRSMETLARLESSLHENRIHGTNEPPFIRYMDGYSSATCPYKDPSNLVLLP
ncbi:hypothetical protein V8C26DRAFT_146981 [Trichoderma gracile]